MISTENIAKICHEANKAYCESIGDFSQVSWDFAPDWQKQSAISGVEAVLNDPDFTPRKSHESWLKHKEGLGWKYGIVKDAVKLEHPCILPYDLLPLEQKIKDELFLNIVHAILGSKVKTKTNSPIVKEFGYYENPEDVGYTAWIKTANDTYFVDSIGRITKSDM